ncbi:A/G-specific adenine glycosylase [candidate division CSSED10-310 bacterium]|uniref:Adenine DNA glycosylase n=1 Tax=candidate division CSSED10-310 bacterium TaxID=2855610 RepID=A0ABV6YWD1_UNCC1
MLIPAAQAQHQRLQKQIEFEGLSEATSSCFRQCIYDYYHRAGRDFPWRSSTEPYHIFISEIMLQQTQTDRVLKKYPAFIKEFPDFQTLSSSSLPEILSLWQGLGYNRRALALKKSAHIITAEHGGILPDNPDILKQLPGIGKATAASISVFAFNKPIVFIETNIRTVYLYFFFSGADHVSDHQIIPLVDRTLDRHNPHKWYSALMDFGADLKKTCRHLNKKSAHYTRQSPFKGSNRRIRGLVLKILLQQGKIHLQTLIETVGERPQRVETIIRQLQSEGFLELQGPWCYLRNEPA